jgi:glycosyltransferase involved in cell wall biosynthesis
VNSPIYNRIEADRAMATGRMPHLKSERRYVAPFNEAHCKPCFLNARFLINCVRHMFPPRDKMQRVLVVGQTPPPYHGQSVVIQKILDAEYPGTRLYHVRMGFSDEMDEIGSFKVKKIFLLMQVIYQIYWVRIRHNTRVLYYPPAGPSWIPVLRDIAILLISRWLFVKVIFHFHACGISEWWKTAGPITRLFLRLAYSRPDVAIRASRLSIDDGEVFGAKQEFIIPCGIHDEARPYLSQGGTERTSQCILYVGGLSEEKGVLVLLEAARQLTVRGCRYQLHFVGKFVSPEFENLVIQKIRQYQLGDHVRFLGVLTGAFKAAAYAAADVFCFPSHHPTETFGVVTVEALSFQLPVVATHWRATPDIIDDGRNGYLVPIRDPEAMADRLEQLLADQLLRARMGRAGRAKFESEFTLEQFHRRFEQVFEALRDR